MEWTIFDSLAGIMLCAAAYFIWWIDRQAYATNRREFFYKSRKIIISPYQDARGKKQWQIVVNNRSPVVQAPSLKLAEERGRAIIDKL
jgi:hypothetical protein